MKSTIFWLCFISLSGCQSPRLINLEKLPFEKEETQILSNGLKLRTIENLGLTRQSKNTLLAIEVINQTDSTINLRQSKLVVKNLKGIEHKILNPKLRQYRNKKVVSYYLKEFGVVVKQFDTPSKNQIPNLEPNRDNLSSAMVTGAANLVVANVSRKNVDKYFQSEIFTREIPKNSKVYGLVVVEKKVKEQLKFSTIEN